MDFELVNFKTILQCQKERVNILYHLLAQASGDGDYRRIEELRTLLYIEKNILTEMEKKYNQ